MENSADDPSYDAAASSASKATIFTFLATCVYLFFFSGVVPTLFSASGFLGFLLGGGAFVFIGMLAVSILISMPLFLLRTQVPALGALISIADIAATIFATRFVYLWLFASPEAAVIPFEARCDESLPTFTLGYESKPSDEELRALCSCIFDTLSPEDRTTASEISRGSAPALAGEMIEAFARRFGGAVDRCGGSQL